MKINVFVEYDQPKTDKFSALLNQYNEAKRLADETVSYYKPLADAAEEAKVLAILDQLETIKGYLLTLNQINPKISRVSVKSQFCGEGRYFTARVERGQFHVYWDNYELTPEAVKLSPECFTDKMHSQFNILGMWDAWVIYPKLEAACLEELERETRRQKTRAEAEVKRLENIVGG